MGAFQNLRELAAKGCYDTWALQLGVLIPWEHITERERQAFRDVLEYAGEEPACADCGYDMICPLCCSSYVCPECQEDMVCPSCDDFIKRPKEAK